MFKAPENTDCYQMAAHRPGLTSRKNKTEGLLVEDVSAITHIDKEKIFKCETKRREELDITHPNR